MPFGVITPFGSTFRCLSIVGDFPQDFPLKAERIAMPQKNGKIPAIINVKAIRLLEKRWCHNLDKNRKR